MVTIIWFVIVLLASGAVVRPVLRVVSTALMLALVGPAFAAHAAAGPGTDPPIVPAPLRTAPNAIPGRYIVTLDDTASVHDVLRALPGVKARHTYSGAVNGFSAALTAAQVDTVRNLAGVRAVEEDATVGPPTGGPRPAAGAPASASGGRVAAASWGLDRIDQRALPLDGQYNTTADGSGVNAYVIDSGIDLAHTEFEGRITVGFDAVGDGRNGQDCNGHGTHVAGILGGATYGVAPRTNLTAIRVLNCDNTGALSDVIAGMDYVALHAQQPAVANISIGAGFSRTTNEAVNRLAEQGIVPTVSAGNGAEDACTRSPASAERSIAVGATETDDSKRETSNTGECVWIYAPGGDITSAKLNGGSEIQSGTSQAAPHVAGVAALYKQLHPTTTTETVRLWLAEQSTKNTITGLPTNTPNRLLHTGNL
ncbi:S8 family peptidase [Streptomyces lavendulae]|uniref:S8 family peptidase n=1 Tax=Streptomyces lavendulae TaxID=1914 RepID=UPI0038130C1F